jgi:AMP-polyphosphate phosphotransferase
VKAKPAKARAKSMAAAHADEESIVGGKGATVLDRVDLSKTIAEDKYEKTLERLQDEVGALTWQAWDERRSPVIVFEGWDAAGKGGAIRRLIAPVDPRLYRVISIAAPTDEERAQHYLWRFWRQIPRDGAMTVYDRSWYGRVLVERVEKFATIDEWSRAYNEINEFEEQLTEHGIILMKFWLHIDPAEQLKRFRERETVERKQYKIGPDDWRNRKKTPAYMRAVHDMVSRTSSAIAPWNLVAANDKHFARIEVLRQVAKRLKKALGE